jgi:4-diphosphocytidyl-2-C-methyl-D-erythritol kinase
MSSIALRLSRTPRRRIANRSGAITSGIKRVSCEAPAKLNIGLAIGPRRNDGFHDIFGLFQTVSIFDALEIRRSGASGSLKIEGDFGCPPETSSVARAVEVFRGHTRIRDGLHISVAKRIPSGAGLGGASTDAASTLRLLNALFGAKLPIKELVRLGAMIGSDVPFFLQPSGLAAVGGRGEKVVPLPAIQSRPFVVAWPGYPSSTPRAYAALDEARAPGPIPVPPHPSLARVLIEWCRYARKPSRWRFVNDFQTLFEKSTVEVETMREAFEISDASFVSLSGSGAAWFAAYPSPERANDASALLADRWARLPPAGGARFVQSCFSLASSQPVSYNYR